MTTGYDDSLFTYMKRHLIFTNYDRGDNQLKSYGVGWKRSTT